MGGKVTSQLSPERRAAELALAGRGEYDVVVIGGGVTGAGAALDAASRGLSVVLVEAGDLASGTSSRSGKLFHGGLRYLEQFRFGLVRQALVERDLMVSRLCPYLVRAEPFLIPFTRRWERPYIGAGVGLYDLLRLTGPRSVRGHRHLTRKRALREMPALRTDLVTGAVQYHDVRVDDARHTMTVARTAAGLGAVILTRTPVVAMVTAGSGARRVSGVRVRDALTGAEVDVRARVVINAAGVWADRVQGLADPLATERIDITPAKGVHLVVPGDRIDSRTGLIARAGDSVFIIRRWFDHWLLGTTDTPWDEGLDEPAASESDVDYLLGQAARWLRRPLTRADLTGVYAGLRPLVSGGGGSTAALSRDHTVVEGPPGLVTVVGGKYTTYRIMARDVVDVATRGMAPSTGGDGARVPDSCTDRLPLIGTDGYETLRSALTRSGSNGGLSASWIEHLLGRYGANTTELLDLVADDPRLGRPVPGAPGYLAAEFVYAVSHEGALTLDDLLTRRARTFMETQDHGVEAAPRVARLVADALGWDADRCDQEVASYRARLEAAITRPANGPDLENRR